MSRNPSRSGYLVVAALSLLALIVSSGCTTSTSTAANNPAADKPAKIKVTPKATLMPDVRGQILSGAEEQLNKSGVGWRQLKKEDLSPLDRGVWDSDNWTVAITTPAPGTPLRKGEDIYVYYLRTSEYQWFVRHPRMPKFRKGAKVSRIVDRHLGPISELVEVRSPRKSKPYFPRRQREDLPSGSPAIEPVGEWKARETLETQVASVALFVRSQPGAGRKIRFGQLITIVGRDKPVPSSEGSSNSYGGGAGYGNDDDDFNVPGWLCPTRFC